MVRRCALCGGTDLAPSADVALGSGLRSWPTTRCSDCGHRQRGTTPEFDPAAYGDEYYTHHAPTPHARDALMKLALKISPPPCRVLDVGSGNGSRLLRASAAGYEAEGFDVDEGAANTARAAGAIVRVAPSVAEAGFGRQEFDLVFANHVAEHVPDPVSLLSEIAGVLRRAGTALVAVPNAESLLAQTFGSGWSEHDPSRHLQFFGPATFRRALERAGFSRVELIGRALLRPKIFGRDLKHLVERKEPHFARRAMAATVVFPPALAVGLLQERTDWRGVLRLSSGMFAVARK